jgi:drug/metabolite transporter (DMT)-like permease
MGAGLGFALTSICVRLASRHLATGHLGGGGHDIVLAALVVLVVTQTGQVLMQGGWVLAREPDEIMRVLRAWRHAAPVGVLSSVGSACWFTGFATAPVALVRTVGQVDVFFTIGFARAYLGERPRREDVAALMAIGGGVVLAVAGSF